MAVERSGGGDPARTIALLWGGPPEPKVGRKPKVSVGQVVSAAISVADREGLGAMSMARVAQELGVGTMSLYTHVPGKAELIDLMADGVLRERNLAAAGTWRERIEHYADRTRAVYRAHPWMRDVSMVRPPLGPGLMDGEEFLLAALTDSGLAPRQAAVAQLAIEGYVHGAAASEVDDQQLEEVTGESGDSWWRARQVFWDDYFDVERYPVMTCLWRAGAYDVEGTVADSVRRSFDYGLGRLLDGIEGGLR
ncbi:TetR/AcrR family transcriptional regulator [Pseudonocardia acaciae]|uniref:TetR/AcrR family transcriptional regulator n=1 Tax=Pseudonocardia acaciae TaxID=551276 RepID=UPI0004905487|nr:TetR/AcrR family transcriptional regulator [Pseudonocardia acaciae]